MCFSNTYLDDRIVVITHSQKHLHTQVASSFPLPPVPFSIIYFRMTRFSANCPLLKHLGHFLPKVPFLQSDLVLSPCAQTRWHLCVVSGVELCLEFQEAGERRWSQSLGTREEEWHLCGVLSSSSSSIFLVPSESRPFSFRPSAVTGCPHLSCCCPEDSVWPYFCWSLKFNKPVSERGSGWSSKGLGGGCWRSGSRSKQPI